MEGVVPRPRRDDGDTALTGSGAAPTPAVLLRALHRRARDLGLPPPAAFLGRWLDADAVVVPSVDLRPCPSTEVLDGPGPVRVCFRSYTDEIAEDPPLLPAAVSGTADGALALRDGRWSTLGEAPGVSAILQRWGEPADGTVPFPEWNAPDRSAHRAGVLHCLDAIRAGEVYQACLSTRIDGRLGAPPVETFLRLTERSAAAKASFLEGPWGAVVSLSPETYLSRRGPVVESSPIKGTVPASADPADLRASVKDVAENIMIVDLVRHDLGTVAEIGSVEVNDLLSVRSAPGVHHLVSTIRARTGVGHDVLVDATFPPASVTGTPKLRARELLTGWEPRSRGLHCGAIGLAHGDALDLSVAIRTIEVAPDGRAQLGVGGGITADSDPDAEWAECLAKAAFAWGGGPPPWER